MQSTIEHLIDRINKLENNYKDDDEMKDNNKKKCIDN